MFAVMKTGGKQYRVAPDDVLDVEKLAAEVGETVRFDQILMLGGEEVAVGNPVIDGATVQAEVIEQKRGPKTLNLKRRRRKHGSRRLKGHRQFLTTVRIMQILGGGKKAGAMASSSKSADAEPAEAGAAE